MFYRSCLFSLHTTFIKKYIFINLEDFPTGSWLGDDSNVEMRVRCGITPRYRYTHTTWKLHFYNEIYFAWGGKNTPIPLNASEIQSFVRMLTLSSGEWVYKKNMKTKFTGSCRFKVLNSPIHSIQREVMKDFEYLKSQI